MSTPDPFLEEDAAEEIIDRKEPFRKAYNGSSLVDLVRAMNNVRTMKERLENQLKDINAHYDVLRIELIPSKMEEEGIESLVVEGIGRVNLTADMYVSVTDKDKFFDWLRANKLGDLIRPSIASSTLKAFIKGRIIKGTPVPEGMVKVTPFTRASITKA